MDSAASEKSIIALDDWLQTPAGVYVRAWEQACLDELTADIFGFNAIQIGLPQLDALAANRMPNKWQAATRTSSAQLLLSRAGSSQIAVALDFEELPFASQSLDLVVLPHVLEFAAEPHQVLREVERVLIPEGQVIICGFNPASLWGARQGLGRLVRSPYLPSAGEFISMPRMKDWLKLLNLRVGGSHFGCYAPPCRSERWINRFAFMEQAGQRWWPYLGAVYMVHAVKRVKGMTMIGPAWNKKAGAARQAVPATNRK
ncbi:class I SAM-dependent methyltransferase [Massilia sp. PAMC28688]|uniref:class I SAM-dependent methyltransferase n=1 Tax=Massilia sp. PAMC28688 TaxID=2861283 RepID=UPI001C62BF94|nr:class I SAM-dependent methyltransferase [Massilia sp. PAMC28688]QYF93216.1 class I SAM-dependent methyltransferase [Massilia sp. PAMC28688]